MAILIIKDIRLPITEDSVSATEFAHKKLEKIFGPGFVTGTRIYKKSVDTRHKNNITCVYSVAAECAAMPDSEILEKYGITPAADEEPAVEYGDRSLAAPPLVVGNGPAGMFCALMLAENGYAPIVIEKGDNVQKRKEAVKRFYRTGLLDVCSNIQNGAGGAGTFSDGKLVTRVNDSRCRYVLKRFVENGAPESVLTSAKPHIGTDRLTVTVGNINRLIEKRGGKILYRTSLLGFVRDRNGLITAVRTTGGEIECGVVILATGNSAGDIYGNLGREGIKLTEKPLSVGLRIEHLRSETERSVFGQEILKKAEKDQKLRERLGHAEYAMSYRENGRGVYTFCMCPGGEVIAGSSEENGIVTNGMSMYARNGRNSNCAVCVSVMPQDVREFGSTMEFCRSIERAAYRLGGGGYRAPVETVADFLSGKEKGLSASKKIEPTYMGGNGNIAYAPLNRLFPSFVNDMLRKGLRAFGGKLECFASGDAVLTAPETRTSSPYRIERLEDGSSADCENLYPCGEGAGYSGGITSSAVDGIEAALNVMKKYKPRGR